MWIWTLLIVMMFTSAYAAPQRSQDLDVYVVPIHGDITSVTVSVVKEGIEDALEQNASAIIFDIDTYGGYIDAAEKIRNEIIDVDIPTIAYVNNKAESAGVLITLSAEKVAMNTVSTIGSAETIPNTEKVMSMWLAMLRDTATYRSRDPLLATAMADQEVYIRGLKEKGRLLNLTAKEAMELKFIDTVAGNYEDLLDNLGIDYNNIISSNMSPRNRLSSILTNPTFNTIMLIIGFIGAAAEIFLPGFGIAGAISIIGFGLFFAGNLITGSAEWMSLMLFLLGLTLIGVELMLPGFGLPGISGIIITFTGLVLSMRDFYSAILSLSIAIIVSTVFSVVIVKMGFTSPLFTRIVLNTNLETKDAHQGYEFEHLIGLTGVALTVLRPSGTVDINGIRYDAITNGEFISSGEDIMVSDVVGQKIIVRRTFNG